MNSLAPIDLLAEKKAADQLAAWNILGTKDLAEPLPPIPWLVEGVRLAPGAVALVAGYGYSRKTLAMQSLALSVATGKPLWGLWRTRKGRAVHLDYEQGRRVTQERYQRLARGQGLELGDLEHGSLRVASMPRMYLEGPEALGSLERAADGATLIIVDSLRAACPHADENSSEVRTYLDALTRVSERSGATIVVVHHARKPSNDDNQSATYAIRGSSALFDACQAVYVFVGEKNEPTLVHHQKDRITGSEVDDFGLVSEDTSGSTGPRHGLVVRHQDLEQLEAAENKKQIAKNEAGILKAMETIRLVIVKAGGTFVGPRADVRTAARSHQGTLSTNVFDVAWARMLHEEKTIVRLGSFREPSWSMQQKACFEDPDKKHALEPEQKACFEEMAGEAPGSRRNLFDPGSDV